MTDLRKAAEQALEALDALYLDDYGGYEISKHESHVVDDAINALRQALAHPEQEPVTLLPDGSAFGVMSFPLPESHWLYAEREYRDGEHEPIELGKPILTHKLRNAVVSAMRYAIRGATNLGKEMDFDPDALVQNAVYALCGPYTPHVDAVNISQERVDETAKREHEPIGYAHVEDLKREHHDFWVNREQGVNEVPLYTAPPKQEWDGPTDEEYENFCSLIQREEAKLKEKNGG